MPTITSKRNYVVCQPGTKAMAEAAFPGIEVIIEPGLTEAFQIRQRALTLEETLEQEVEKAERFEADPKQAETFVLALAPDAVLDPWATWLTIRVKQNRIAKSVGNVVKDTPLFMVDGEPDTARIIGDIRANLIDEGFEVFSISEGSVVFLKQ